jgi:hypothetical protein
MKMEVSTPDKMAFRPREMICCFLMGSMLDAKVYGIKIG